MKRFAYLASLLLLASFAAPAANAAIPAPPDPPGVVIDKSPDFQKNFVGSPSMEILPDGTYVASHDWFGEFVADGTPVFQSKDKGATWTQVGRIPFVRSAMIFYNKDALYAIGYAFGQGKVATGENHQYIMLAKSTDGGANWVMTRLAGDDEHSYFVDPGPVLIHNGRVWKEIEQVNPKMNCKRNWATGYYPVLASVPVDCDLLDVNNWTFSNPVPYVDLGGEIGGWLEGNAIFDQNDDMLIQMRVDDWKNCGKAAQIRVSKDGKTATFDPETGIVPMPGGAKKFVIRFDEKSGKYWALVNWVHPDDVDAPDKERTRNTLALVCSENLKDWEIRSIIYRRENLAIGFQYCDWRAEGDDMVFVCRLGWTGAHNCHDANYLIFDRIKNFRERTREDDAPTWAE